MSAVTKERRRYFRIEDTVNLMYKKVEEDDIAGLSHISSDVLNNCTLAVALDSLSQEAQIISSRLDKNNSELFDYLKILDTKINLIAQSIMMQSSDFCDHDARNVNMSASGLAFEAEEAIEVGRFLEIKVMLTSCMAVVVAYAKVIYCRENGNEAFPYFVGIDYVNLKDDDRELLIKHVVKKQMQQIREIKKSQ